MKLQVYFCGLLWLFASCESPIKSALPMGEIPFPRDNPPSAEKIALGRQLFFDKRLSSDNSISCASCHLPEKAFTDGKRFSDGVKREKSLRNAPSILNAAYFPRLMFDGEIRTLELQVLAPIQSHTEMNANMRDLIPELAAVPEYRNAAKKLFNRSFDAWVLTRSLAAFERSLISQNSRFDQFMAGDKEALTVNERAGWKLFNEQLYCSKCHPAPAFTTYQTANNGLYSDYRADQGRYRINGLEREKGSFKIPSLRNISLTSPYMHDGSLKSLEEVLEHYAKGGQKHNYQSQSIVSFSLTKEEKEKLIQFLKSLTDTSYLETK
jgi:cytochrome c peroxidase